MRCRRPARSRSTSRRSAWTCCRSRRTSSTGPRASARCGSAAASGSTPFVTGGRQERGRRAGTENVAGIAGLGPAAALARAEAGRRGGRGVAALRDRLEQGILAAVPGAERNGVAEPRVPNTTNISVRARRVRVAADRAGPRRHRRVVRLGLLVGHARAVARAEGDGLAARTHARLDSLQPRRVEHRGRDRSRGRRAAEAGREAATPGAAHGV